MRAICFIQEVKSGDLTMRQQILICRKALRKLRWPCVQELYAQAGTEDQPLSLRPGMADLLRAAADGEADVLIVVDAEHLHCGRPELEGLIASLLCYGIHTFGVIIVFGGLSNQAFRLSITCENVELFQNVCS